VCNSYTDYPEIFTALLLVCLLLASLGGEADGPALGAAEQLPTAQDVNNLADNVKVAIDTFEQQSFRLRMQYQYGNRFLSDGDRENLRAIADAAGNKLAAIAKEQNELKQQIEDYTGDDWDNKYGTTGLWRKVTKDLHTTKLAGLQIDYWRALACDQAEQLQMLKNILIEMERLDLKPPPSQRIRQTSPPPAVQVLKARVYALLAKSEPDYKQAATKEYDDLKTRSDISAATAFRAAIEEAGFFGPDEPNRLDTMPQQIVQAGLCDDVELIIAAASLLRRQNHAEAFEKMIQLCPQVSDAVGALALADLSSLIAEGQKSASGETSPRGGPQQTSVFEAELAAKAAWIDGPQNHTKTLAALADDKKFQTPFLLYVTALAVEDSRPVEAVELLIHTSTLQQSAAADKTEKSPMSAWGRLTALDVAPQELAAQAAELAFNLFVEKKTDCGTALKAFENYEARAPEKVDDKLKYLNSVILYECGQAAKGRQLRRELADGSEGYWRNRARVDLISEALEQKEFDDEGKRNALAEELKDIIGESGGSDAPFQELKKEATVLYCQLLLNGELVEPLTSNQSGMLQRMNRLAEAAVYMTETIEMADCEYADEALALAAEIIDRIEQLQADANDPTKTSQDCRKMAQFAYDCLDSEIKRRAGLVLAEATIVAAASGELRRTAENEQLLKDAEKLLENLAKDIPDEEANYLRCRARLLTEQHKFAEAAGLWSSIADILKQEKSLPDGAGLPAERTWSWWQAKFYELYCWSRLSQTKAAEVLHAVEVLQNSYEHIPPLWEKKLQELKAQIK
jgi:hypothetical protein